MRVLTGSPQSQRMQNGGGAALVRTVVDRELRRAMRGSCERARTGGAALSTTAARTRGAALAPSAAGRAMNAVWQRPVCQCRLGLRGCRSTLPGWSRALRPRSQPARFLPSGGDRQRGPRRGGLAECSALGASCQCATSRRSTRALRSGRGAQAQGSVRACECDGERSYLAAPTRSTGHRLAISWSSPDAAGRDRRGFARRSGTALSGPCPTGV